MENATILIVDDEPDVAHLLAYHLHRQGFHAVTAPNGLTACRLIADHRPELILLDLMLPDLDGREICRLIRGHTDERLASTPILMLTARATADDRVAGLSVGADDYVVKPFSVDEVILRVSKILSRRKSEQEAANRVSQCKARESALLELQDILFHELKNQLLVVGGFSNRLSRDGGRLPPEKVRAYARAIHQSSRHLGSMAEELLLLRRIGSGDLGMPVDKVDVGELARETVDVSRAKAEEKSITVCVDVPEAVPSLVSNRMSLKIVLSCLVENAIKYGREGGRVTVSCGEGPGREVSIAVEDDGVGIPEDELDRVFEKFYRGSNSTKKTNGTGLGLYFAKTLTEALGGSIRVRSTVGEGSRFEVALPLSMSSSLPQGLST